MTDKPQHDDDDPPRRAVRDRQSWQYALRTGLAGGLAGCAAKTAVGPLDRVKILFQASNPQFVKYTGSWLGFARALGDIYTSAGTRGLFLGHSATLLRIFPYAGIKFLAYEQVRAVLIPSAAHETPLRRFASGSLAGTLSVCCTYPLEVVRVRLAYETRGSRRRGALMATVRDIYTERAAGVSGFFRGFLPTLVGMLPYAGMSFLTHDAAGDLMRHPLLAPYTTVNPSSERQTGKGAGTLRAWAELFTGGVAGLVSQTVSYPLEVVRRRMQVGGVVGDGGNLSMRRVATDIFHASGWRGFFVGLGIGYIKVVPMVAVSFFVYERSKRLLHV